MSTPTACPADATLALMLADRLAGGEADSVEAHVAACVACQAALERLTAPETVGDATAWSAPPTGGTWDAPRPPAIDDPAGPGRAPLPDLPGYRIEREIGHGGMGVVYLARQALANRLVALKMVRDNRGRQEDLIRFRLEGETLARLQHPNIVQVFEIGSHGGALYFSMEYVEGSNLAESIAARARTPAEAAGLVETLARAIHAAHQCGVVHRDLKPANILLAGGDSQGSGSGLGSRSGSGSGTAAGTPKVTDFGLAKQVGSASDLTHTGQILGTPSYMAPEQASGGASVGVSADIYALGAILYELLTGRPPFRGGSPWETLMQVVHEPVAAPSTIRPGLPRDLEVICLKCLAKAPGDRYASADALAEDLRRFRAGEPILARPAGAARLAYLWCRRRPAVAALLGSLLLTGLLGAGGVAVQWRRAEVNRVFADWNREVAERRLRLAEASFLATCKSLHEYFINVSQDVLLNEPHSRPLRRELLSKGRTGLVQVVSAAGPFLESETARKTALYTFGLANYDLGVLEDEIGNSRTGLDYLAKAEQIFSGLDDAVSQADRVLAINRMGRIRRNLGDKDSTAATLERAVALGRDVVRAHPDNPATRFALAQSLLNLGEYDAVFQAQPLKGVERVREAQAIWVRLLAEKPDQRSWLLDLVATHGTLGRIRFMGGDFEGAAAAHREAVAAATRLVALDARSVASRSTLASVQANLAGALVKLGRPREAVEPVDAAVATLEQVAREQPYHEYRYRLLSACTNAADINRMGGDPARGERLAARASEVGEALVRDVPDRFEYALALGGHLGNLGNASLDKGRFPEALERYDRAIAALDAVLARVPNHPQARSFLMNSQWGRADALVGLGRPADSLAAWDRAAALAAGPKQVDFRLRKAAAIARAGDYARAAAEADRALAEPKRPDAAPTLAARAFALAAGAARSDPKLDPAARSRVADGLAARAVALLADRPGQKGAGPQTLRSADFDAIRDRADFRALMDAGFPADPFAH